MKVEKLTEPLSIDQVDFRIQSINKGGYATILAYKDARVDMNRLDDVFGVFGWQKKFELINGNLFCSVGIFDKDNNQWIWKSDVGTESFTEKEKGQASDAFKRACFNLGIGRELYDYPVISIKLNSNEWELKDGKVKQTWNLQLRDWTWLSKFENGRLVYLSCVDNNNKERWSYPEKKVQETKRLPKPDQETVDKIAETIKSGAYTKEQWEKKYDLTNIIL